MTYIFSVRPKTFEKIRDLIDEKTKLGKLRISDMSEEEGSKVVRREMEIEAKILKILQESGEKYVYFDREDERYKEDLLAFGMKSYLDDAVGCIQKNVYSSPKSMAEYYDKVKKYLESEDIEEKVRSYLIDEIGVVPENIHDTVLLRVISKWTTILKHFSENGNWYYFCSG